MSSDFDTIIQTCYIITNKTRLIDKDNLFSILIILTKFIKKSQRIFIIYTINTNLNNKLAPKITKFPHYYF